MKTRRPWERSKKRTFMRAVQISWTPQADTDLDTLATVWQMSRSQAAREAIRRAVAELLYDAREEAKRDAQTV